MTSTTTKSRPPTKKQREAQAAQRRHQSGSEFTAAIKVLSLVLLAFLMELLPLIGNVLGILETFFHELGHALVAEATGRDATRLTLNWDGSGAVNSQGPSQGLAWIGRVLTAWFGYTGAILFGILLYAMIDIDAKKGRWLVVVLLAIIGLVVWQVISPIWRGLGDNLVAILLGLLRLGIGIGVLAGLVWQLSRLSLLSQPAKIEARHIIWTISCLVGLTLLWLAQDFSTWVIGSLLAAVLAGAGYALHLVVGKKIYPGKLVMRFFGIALVVLSMKSAWALWSIDPPHDAASLAQATFVFQFVWILSWEVCGIAALWFLFRTEVNHTLALASNR